jgi:Tol biopolymer transport system component
MAPEQVRGQDADHRADIFALGVILHEMLSGQRPFRGASAVEVMHAILNAQPPDLSELNRAVAPGLDRIVQHCLDKQPERRFQSAHDLRFALEALVPSFSSYPKPAVDPYPAGRVHLFGRLGKVSGWAVAGFLSLAVVALVLQLYFHRPAPDLRVHTLSVLPPDKAMLVPGEAPLVSPDGRVLAFVATDSAGKNLIFIRAFDSGKTQALAGTEDAQLPFWSPDGRALGFFAGAKLRKIELTGGTPQTLADAPNGWGGAWNQNGVIIFSPSPAESLYRVSAQGGERSPISTINTNRLNPRWLASFLPDGRHYLFLMPVMETPEGRKSGDNTLQISVGTLDSNESKPLLRNNSNAIYALPGYLLFRRDGTLMAQRFNADHLQLAGEAFAIAEEIGFGLQTHQGSFSVSGNGILAYQSGAAGKTEFTWMDRGGAQGRISGSAGYYTSLSLSPDGKQIAFTEADYKTQSVDIWLMQTADDSTSRFTLPQRSGFMPIWSPDSSQIAFASTRDGPPNLFQKVATGAGDDQALFRSPIPKLPCDWSPNGLFIAYSMIHPETGWDVWVLPLGKDQKPSAFLNSRFNEGQARFSPNGHWIAYVSDESGRNEVYVRPFPPAAGQWQVSTAGGSQPRWRRDGQELFYRAADRKLMARDVDTNAASFSLSGAPKTMLATSIGRWKDYEIAPDGQQILVNRLIEEANYAPVTVVLNWPAAVKQ